MAHTSRSEPRRAARPVLGGGLAVGTMVAALIIHEDPAAGMRIERLAADYTRAQSTVATFPSLESPAMAKIGGRYFLLTSHLTGWATNDNVYATATSLAGPWSGFSNFAAAGTRTYDCPDVVPATGHRQRWYQLRVLSETGGTRRTLTLPCRSGCRSR